VNDDFYTLLQIIKLVKYVGISLSNLLKRCKIAGHFCMYSASASATRSSDDRSWLPNENWCACLPLWST